MQNYAPIQVNPNMVTFKLDRNSMDSRVTTFILRLDAIYKVEVAPPGETSQGFCTVNDIHTIHNFTHVMRTYGHDVRDGEVVVFTPPKREWLTAQDYFAHYFAEVTDVMETPPEPTKEQLIPGAFVGQQMGFYGGL